MSDDEKSAEGRPGREGPNVYQYHFPDWVLVDLVKHANDTDGGVSMVLSVGGQTVSGMLIPAKEWARQMSESLDGASSSEGDLIDRFTARTLPELENIKVDDPDAWPPFYGCFRDASVDGIKVGLWRVRLIEVEGWTVGEL